MARHDGARPMEQMVLNVSVALRLGWPVASLIVAGTIVLAASRALVDVPGIDAGRSLAWGFVGMAGGLVWRESRPDATPAGRRNIARSESWLPVLAVALLAAPIAPGVMALGSRVLPSEPGSRGASTSWGVGRVGASIRPRCQIRLRRSS